MLLQKKGEGQWLVPGLCEPDRWQDSKPVDYDSVRAVWLHRYQQRLDTNSNLDVVIEKSPPNLVRIRSLLQHFSRYSLLAYNRNPIANCASRLYREKGIASMDGAARIKALGRFAKSWLDLSRQIRLLVLDLDIPLLTYEEFCLDTASALGNSGLPAQVLEGINPQAQIQVKDYAVAGIVNKNIEQINLLSPDEISHIIGHLESEVELLSFYGYKAEVPAGYKRESGHR